MRINEGRSSLKPMRLTGRLLMRVERAVEEGDAHCPGR